MLSISLGLPEFQIVKQELLSYGYAIHVEKTETQERCPHCGFLTSTVHDRRTRKVRDLAVFRQPVYLFVEVKRYRCWNCFQVFSASFESIPPNQYYTNRCYEYFYELCEGSTIQEVSRKHRIPYTTLERIYYSIASKKAKERQAAMEASSPEGMVLSLDEIAVKKGQQYETVLMDAKAGSVMGMHADRQCDSAINLLSQNVLSKEMVQTVILDMWEPYHKAVRALFPSASIVIDKYHVVQKVTQALDQARKELSSLKKARFLLLKGYEKLRKDQRLRLDDILEEYPLSIAYYLKELFRDFYRTEEYNEAKERLEEWIGLAKQSPFASFQQAANTLERWKEPILSYFLCSYTNARIEGTNHKIKNIKRRAYGYRNRERFRLHVFLECTGNTTGSQAA
uniref:Transposase IS204/IS1001/IS1096/IS1165 family protein n=1 Tax=Geobacillus sp. (strain Y4.1MC1) TaxID=581103 RepID=A0A7U4DMP4_GEOS0